MRTVEMIFGVYQIFYFRTFPSEGWDFFQKNNEMIFLSNFFSYFSKKKPTPQNLMRSFQIWNSLKMSEKPLVRPILLTIHCIITNNTPITYHTPLMTNSLRWTRLHRGAHISRAAREPWCNLANAKLLVRIPLSVKSAWNSSGSLRL